MVISKHSKPNRNEENIIFYEDVQNFKETSIWAMKVHKFYKIVKKFLSNDSSIQLNLPYCYIQVVESKMDSITEDPDLLHEIFDSILTVIVKNMEDSFMRFVKSDLFERSVEILREIELENFSKNLKGRKSKEDQKCQIEEFNYEQLKYYTFPEKKRMIFPHFRNISLGILSMSQQLEK
jgi:hypothetical protein